MNLEGPMGGCWVPIKYEKLPEFCYSCGKIGHTRLECDEVVIERHGQDPSSQYGSWLRYQGEGRSGGKESEIPTN